MQIDVKSATHYIVELVDIRGRCLKDQHEEDVRINTQLVVVWNVKAPQGWVMRSFI